MSWFTWSLLSALFAAATALLAKMGVTQVEPNLATAVRTSVVMVLAWAIVFSVGSHRELVALDRRSLLFLVASGLATGLSWLCYFRALASGPASRVAPVDKLSVVFVILLAAPLLGESITRGKVLGGVLITAGAIVLAFAK
ncbi:MAG: EamA family transporter [Acidobacteriaceae bacterium]|nr:EamA family transporter [Acidobacteriaceae bacterium]